MSEFASTYDALAPRYDDWAAAVRPDLRRDWVAKLDAVVGPGERVVELGCGTAAPVGVGLAARYEYTGIDASAGMLEQARARMPAASFYHRDMEDVTFAPGSLGAVVAMYSIIHVPRERHAGLFAAIASWLRPGGGFVATIHSRDNEDDFDPDWLGGGPMRWTGFDATTNLALLEMAGFDIIEAEVIEQLEPAGNTIRPLWVFASRARV